MYALGIDRVKLVELGKGERVNGVVIAKRITVIYNQYLNGC